MAVAPASTARSGVVDPGDALDHERPAPLLAQPGDVVPGRRRGLHPLAVDAEEGRRRRSPGSCMLGTVRSGMPLGPGEGGQPARVASAPRARTACISVRSIFSGMCGLPQSRPIENDQSRVTMRPTAPGGAGPLDALQDLVPCARPSRSGRTSAGWRRRPPRRACWRTSSAPSRCRGRQRRGPPRPRRRGGRPGRRWAR